MSNKKSTDLIIKDGLTVTVNPKEDVLQNASIVIKHGLILDIDTPETIDGKYTAPQTIDASKKIVMPGLVNTHTHSAMTVFRGFADDIPLRAWLMDNIFPLEERFVSPKMVKTGMSLAIAEMIMSGTTTFNDMYYYQGDAADIVKKMGMRALLTESIADFKVPNSKDYLESIKYSKALAENYKNDSLITIGASVHAPYTSNPEILLAVKEFTDSNNLIFDIHVAETQWEIETIQKKYGKSPVKFLDDLRILNQRTVAAHSIHLNSEDIEIYKNRQVGVAHNPECNMKISSGISPVPQFLANGIKVGLGTDGAASNNNLDMFEEMHTMALLHKLSSGNPTTLTARQAVRIATMGGAEVLGMENEIGSIEKGKKADIITLDIDNVRATPMYDPYSALVYSLNGSDVCDSVIDGKLVMQGGSLVHNSLEEVIREANICAEDVRQKFK
ncbi:MAG: amidohydrolase [Bacteroidota bacterium]|nr:amidohydrolase [Bacteroidota bacterium]